MRMQDRVVVVTGAGRGNGRAISKRLAQEAASVVVSDIDAGAAEVVAEAIREAGGQARAVQADVSDERSVAALFAAAKELGGPHAVVAQAGIAVSGPLDETPIEDWHRLMAVDVTGTFLTVREALRAMLPLGGGSIVTMSGTYAVMAEPGASLHCAAKGAIMSFTRAVAAEYGDRGIRCNAIAPGYVATEMVEEFYAGLEDGDTSAKEVASWHALGRIATPEEVANMALFLCSDESSFSSGTAFFVDGGMTAGINANRTDIHQQVRR